MEQVPIPELNQDVFERVEHGETVEITKHGRVIGRIVPARPSSELDDLIAAGRVTPATVHGPFPMPTIKVENNAASEALIAMREEERW